MTYFPMSTNNLPQVQSRDPYSGKSPTIFEVNYEWLSGSRKELEKLKPIMNSCLYDSPKRYPNGKLDTSLVDNICKIDRNDKTYPQDLQDYALVRAIFHGLEDRDNNIRSLATEYLGHILEQLERQKGKYPLLPHIQNYCTNHVLRRVDTLGNVSVLTESDLTKLLKDIPDPILELAQVYCIRNIANEIKTCKPIGRALKDLLNVSFATALKQRQRTGIQGRQDTRKLLQEDTQETRQLDKNTHQPLPPTNAPQNNRFIVRLKDPNENAPNIPTEKVWRVGNIEVDQYQNTNRRRPLIAFNTVLNNVLYSGRFAGERARADLALSGEGNRLYSVRGLGSSPDEFIQDYAMIDALFSAYRSNDPKLLTLACRHLDTLALCLQDKTYLQQVQPMLTYYFAHQVDSYLKAHPTDSFLTDQKMEQALMHWTGCDFWFAWKLASPIIEHCAPIMPRQIHTFTRMSRHLDITPDKSNSGLVPDELRAIVKEREKVLTTLNFDREFMKKKLSGEPETDGQEPQISSVRQLIGRKRTLQEMQENPQTGTPVQLPRDMVIRQDDSTLFNKKPEEG